MRWLAFVVALVLCPLALAQDSSPEPAPAAEAAPADAPPEGAQATDPGQPSTQAPVEPGTVVGVSLPADPTATVDAEISQGQDSAPEPSSGPADGRATATAESPQRTSQPAIQPPAADVPLVEALSQQAQNATDLAVAAAGNAPDVPTNALPVRIFMPGNMVEAYPPLPIESEYGASPANLPPPPPILAHHPGSPSTPPPTYEASDVPLGAPAKATATTEAQESTLLAQSAPGSNPSPPNPSGAPAWPRNGNPSADPLVARDPSTTSPLGVSLLVAAGLSVSLLAFVVAFLPKIQQVLSGSWAALFSRVDRRRALQHPGRQLLLQLVEAQPGISLAALQASAGMSRSNANYHLDVLQRNSLVFMQKVGRNRHFSAAVEEPNSIAQKAALQNERRLQIASFVLGRPQCTQQVICESLALPRSRVNDHVSRLHKAGLIEIARQGREVFLAPSRSLEAILSAIGHNLGTQAEGRLGVAP